MRLYHSRFYLPDPDEYGPKKPRLYGPGPDPQEGLFRNCPPGRTKFISSILHAWRWKNAWLVLGLLWVLAACSLAPAGPKQIEVMLTADGETQQVTVPTGSTVQEAFGVAGISINPKDRSEPPLYAVLLEGETARLIRVEEKLDPPVQEIVPFDHQSVRSESLPEGQKLLSQKGVNGLQEVTVRHVYEDGIEVSSEALPAVVVRAPVPEILVVGIQQVFTPVEIPGRIAYLLGGNVWVMDGNTGVRRPVVKSGDADGRIFSLSSNGEWLLFTRRSEKAGEINTLWVVNVQAGVDQLLDLHAANIIHFAEWAPGSLTLAYSTVEPRSTAPGWQANNDLNTVSIRSSGFVSQSKTELETNSGGVYGWWGLNFNWAPDGRHLAYASPDGLGFYFLGQGLLNPLKRLTPLQTGSDWAWVPGIAWGPDGSVLYVVDHVAPEGTTDPERSQMFDLLAFPQLGGAPIRLASQVGMFAYPTPSPLFHQPSGEDSYQLAYLQAIFPEQSESSAYRLAVMDRDGSNRRVLFPPEHSPGLEPQQVVWSPTPLDDQGAYGLLVIYQGNLWLVNSSDGSARQITGDGLAGRVAWK